MRKLEQDGKVAVLYSPGYGAGWYSWNTGIPAILFDPNIVKYVEDADWNKLKSYMELKYQGVYLGGMESLKVQWIPVGAEFKIAEHDGNETIEYRDATDWFEA